jgi:glutamyl-tRNA synthetase
VTGTSGWDAVGAASQWTFLVVPVTLIDYDYLINKKKIEDSDDFTACLNPVTEYRVKALADANVHVRLW